MIGSRIAGQVRLTALMSAPALGPRLCFRFAWTLGNLPESPMVPDIQVKEYRITELEGEVRLGEHGPAVGLLYQLGERQPLRSLPYVDEQTRELILDLDWFRFERLEEHRQGGPFEIWLKLWPRVEAESGTLEARVDTFQAKIPREDWLEVFSGLTREQTDILEVRYHLTYAGHFRTSLEQIREARAQVHRGDYTGAVVRARKAILLLEEAARDETSDQQNLQATLEKYLDERHAAIYGTVASRIKEMGNIQVHSPSAPDYSRMEALFAIRVSEALLELVGAVLARGPAKG